MHWLEELLGRLVLGFCYYILGLINTKIYSTYIRQCLVIHVLLTSHYSSLYFMKLSPYYLVAKAEILCHMVLIKLPDTQMEDINYGKSAVLQTEGQVLVHTRNNPHIGEVEVLILPLPAFEPWTLITN